MKSKQTILNELASKHPIACGLFIELTQSIDREKRSDSEHDEVRNPSGGDSLLDSIGGGLATLSVNTPMAFDHGVSVLAEVFSSLEEKGYTLEAEGPAATGADAAPKADNFLFTSEMAGWDADQVRDHLIDFIEDHGLADVLNAYGEKLAGVEHDAETDCAP